MRERDVISSLCVWHSIFEEVKKLKKMDDMFVAVLGGFLPVSTVKNGISASKFREDGSRSDISALKQRC